MLDIDGSYGEGGGQLVRIAVALAAICGRAIRLHDIRAKRAKSGLAPQHLAALRAVGALCDAAIEGLALRSTCVTFVPRRIRGGRYIFDVGTAGSVTLVLQALLPVMIHADGATEVEITGGTDVRAAPPFDYMKEVLLPLIAQFGARVDLTLRRRGYFPKGGGIVQIGATPGALRGVGELEAGSVRQIGGAIHTTRLAPHIATRMLAAATEALGSDWPASVATSSDEAAYNPGGAFCFWADRVGTRLGAARVAERGVRAETLGHDAGAELRADLQAAVALDAHAADQILVYAALAGGATSFSTRALSEHARTVIWLLEQFVPKRIAVQEGEGRVQVRIADRS